MSSGIIIKDLFGNDIKITSIKEAVKQVELGCSSPYFTAPFEIGKSGVSKDIKGCEKESFPLAAYNEDMLYKLRLLKISETPKEVNVFFSQEGESLHCWETSGNKIKDVSLMCEAVCSTGLVDESIPVDVLVCEANNAENELIKGRFYTRVY
ncbi:hypothetical protein A3715_19570 [Oleiphilus sp. HI0009]|nr:hypothetical protein A3715_15560 [Oleiphilus sp. HI0009]KZX79368.1 hypothetical protein A3715_19570 [Oleiphilus sp. HI0009]